MFFIFFNGDDGANVVDVDLRIIWGRVDRFYDYDNVMVIYCL